MKSKKSAIQSIGMSLVMLLLLALVAGCAKDEKAAAQFTTPVPATKEHADVNAETSRITDQNGREIKIPQEINRVVITAFPLPAVYYVATGSCEKIVGIHPAAKSKAETSMLSVLAPELMNAATGFIRGKDMNIEELLKLQPDILIFWGIYPKQVEQFEAIDIPAVAVHTIKGGNALETLESWIKLSGRIFGEEARTSKLIAYNHQTMKLIYSRVQSIPKKRRPKALILFYHNANEIIVPGKGHYGQFWMESTGAINVAESISGRAAVNMEQIYKWNPDIIYISNFSDTLPDDILDNAIDGQNWSKVKAVKEGRVYKIPLGIYGWYPPSTDAPLMLKWLAQKHHPKLFDDFTIEKEIKYHYSKFYGYDLSDEQVGKILHPVCTAAKGSRM
jgi:iron complex transport system substrate-binding protein